MKKIFGFFGAGLLISIFSVSCYYDKADQVYPSNGCDTTNMTYTGSIKVILDENCALSGCHSTADASGGYDLSIYDGSSGPNAGSLQAAIFGRLVGTITWSPGFSQMPQGSAQLSSCNIDKIKAWANAGAPE